MQETTFAAAVTGNAAAIEQVLLSVQSVATKAAKAAVARFGGSGVEAEDLSQLALVKAWKALPGFAGSYEQFVARVVRLVANCNSKQYRNARRQKRDCSREQLTDDLTMHASSYEAVDAVVETEQVAMIFDCAMDSLDRAICKQFMEGYTITEIGALNSVSGGVVAGRWKRLKLRVADKFAAC